MIAFPTCKINLGLHIVIKREDGYHELETAFYPIPLNDIIELVPASEIGAGAIEFSQSGLTILGNQENNLCVKAYQLIKKKFPQLPAVKMHLHKEIPTGAGLGGGSSDGAFMLRLLNNQFQLNLTNDELKKLALQLGSDCPYFLLNKPALAFGRGEILEEITIDFTNWHLLLISPAIPISTAAAFNGVRPTAPTLSLRETLKLPLSQWKEKLHNQFEETIFPKYPLLKNIKYSIYEAGAVYASMSGSGSSLYGLFSPGTRRPEQLINSHRFSRWYTL